MHSSAAAHGSAQRVIQSDLFGQIEMAEADLIRFPEGPYGFESFRLYALLTTVQEGVFWLQAAECTSLAFLLVDPERFVEGYHPELSPADLKELGASSEAEVKPLLIATLPVEPEQTVTVNLRGPIAIHTETRLAKQLALSGSPEEFRHPIGLE